MLVNVRRIAARRGSVATIRSSLFCGLSLKLRSLSTTPRRLEAVPATAIVAGLGVTPSTTSNAVAVSTSTAASAVPAKITASDWVSANSLFESPYLRHNNEIFVEFINHDVDIEQLIQQSSHSATGAATETAIPKISAEELELSKLAESLNSEILEATGSFAELGLGGWSPSGLLQTFLYTVNSYGLPWWMTIAATTLTFKLILFPLTIRSQKYAIRMNNHLPELQEIQQRQQIARQEGNNLELWKASNDYAVFLKEKNINPLKGMINMAVQGPVFISFFFALKGMANLPLNSMKTGGMFWFTDLTVPDPFYALPVLTSLTLFATLKLGADSGVRLDNMKWGRYVLGAIPVILLPFTMNFPAAVVCYWSTSNLFTLGQVAVLRIPAVRQRLDLPKLVRHNRENLTFGKKNFADSVREAFQQQKRTRMVRELERQDEIRFKQAGIGPMVKTYKDDPTKAKAGMVAQANKR
ncbi:mitochondrial inner membrane protein OXA1L-like isoform X1 [Varroa jacobsoni]|uniref:mitochondrial inner membrane protein OXA1L-like isoform X1 n=1 Tax=Varroa jacobsoni TaxID=62625 RepID=UPI000BF5412A|nr:mitochondrial inner membrane protein OXA1L-like isoform X1 [Varroa jacobsoni]